MGSQIVCERQLMFDDVTNEIVEEPIQHWKTMDEVPKKIKDFILNIIFSRVIVDSNTRHYHCPKCLKILDDQYYCSNCSKQYLVPVSNDSKYVICMNMENIKNYEEHTRFFAFDMVDGQVLIYIFQVTILYYNRLMLVPFQTNKINIEEVYHVSEDGVINLLTGDFASFQEYDKSIGGDDFDYKLLDVFEFQADNHYLYTSNLDELKNTLLYKYTSIWDLKDYFEKNSFSLASLTYYPLHFKQFEYLVKMQLYSLATTGPYVIKFNRNFRDTFGVDKKYYSFMKSIDINCSQFEALQLCPTTDLNLLNFVAEYIYLFEDLLKYVKADKVMEYLQMQGLCNHNIQEYYDYIKCCEKMLLDMKDKQVLFPKEFIKEHDKITREFVITKDININERMKSLSNILDLNTYEDDKYIIFPADSVDSLINESSQMSNCVRNYCTIASNSECQIYFMRDKNNIDKSLVTIEVRNGKIVQARAKFNELPSDEINEILKRWEKQIVPIAND